MCVNKLDEVTSTVFFFDWDDTLLPTSAVTNGSRFAGSLQPDSETSEELHEHARVVRNLLRTARSFGRVGIVTLALRPWVQVSAEHYLPGVDWDTEFRDLDIPIIYAREALSKNDRRLAMIEEGVDLHVASKAMAMSRALKRMRVSTKALDVISIGDSLVEAEVFGCGHKEAAALVRNCSRKVEELSDELRELTHWIESMTLHDDDFDIKLENTNDPGVLRGQVFQYANLAGSRSESRRPVV
eukprot:TRINITY_DN4447_c0_g1_i3.p1 TRINITY_DN4447_c0_g1~~TRINITY_DN4447_c0_g1_i3.p1  ORF type:complete len:242 (+),score=47.21 TRINITY_DN4447_c0_g1_i3:81-806(+)